MDEHRRKTLEGSTSSPDRPRAGLKPDPAHHLFSQGTRSPAEGWTRARAVLLLHLTLVIATSYLLLAQGDPFQLKSVTAWLILGALVSTLPFLWQQGYSRG